MSFPNLERSARRLRTISVRPITATQTVSRAEVFRFLESQFARADRNHDGMLDIDELALFVQYISHPESNQPWSDVCFPSSRRVGGHELGWKGCAERWSAQEATTASVRRRLRRARRV
jgi:hypothetical protein